MPYPRAPYVGPGPTTPFAMRAFSASGHHGVAVTRVDRTRQHSESLILLVAPDGSFRQVTLGKRIPVDATEGDLVRLGSRKIDPTSFEGIAPFGWLYEYPGLYPERNSSPPPADWEWYSKRGWETLLRKSIAPNWKGHYQDAMMAFEHTACFSWEAFRHAAEGGDEGVLRREFVFKNPLVAATALTHAAARAAIDAGAPLNEVLDAMSTTSKVRGMRDARPIGKRTVTILSGLLDDPGHYLEPMSYCGIEGLVQAVEALPVEWLPRDKESAHSLRRLCAYATPILGKRVFDGSIDWKALLSNSKGDWPSYEKRVMDAMEVPEENSFNPLDYLWDSVVDLGKMIGDLLVPLSVRSQGALKTVFETPYDLGGNGQPAVSLANFHTFAMTVDMNLPAMVSQTARHRRSRVAIRKAIASAGGKISSDGFGPGYDCPYDVNDDEALEAVIKAWDKVVPNSWRNKTGTELVAHLDRLAERFIESLETRH